MSSWLAIGVALILTLAGATGADEPRVVAVPLGADGSVDLAAVVTRLAEATATATPLDLPTVPVELPTFGRSRTLATSYLVDALRPDVAVDLLADSIRFAIGPDPRNAPGSADWARRLGLLAARTRAEADRRARYGFRPRASYRPNDPARPTVCLVHGLNSTSGVFRHLAPALEAAGYGVVTHDFPYNRSLAETSARFGPDLLAFRRAQGDASRWVVVAHSMGGLLARWAVESAPLDEPAAIAALFLIAPPNRGSSLAHGQTLMQAVQALQSVRGERRVDPLAYLGDGLGVAADDLAPGSPYLAALNARPRRAGVAYRILAGDSAYLDPEARRRVEGQLGGFGRLLAGGLRGPLDEITDGLGDGCVAVASARLEGVADVRVIPSNHLELIRAPLLFPDPGPIACLPILLDWLRELHLDPARPPGE